MDTDYDGYSDTTDEFPLDPSQWSDTDNDGFGDELSHDRASTDGDYCPEVAGSSTIDRKGCLDSDGDGYSDPDSSWSTSYQSIDQPTGGDAFPEDSTQHFDGDGDGFGDNPEGYQPDSCPETFGTSTADIFGCRDSDGDGDGLTLLMHSLTIIPNGLTKMATATATHRTDSFQIHAQQCLVILLYSGMVVWIRMVMA